MPRIDNEIRITPSVLDRLIDYEPEQTQEPLSSRSKSLRQLKQSVRRDLEWLLNTRQVALGLPPDLKEVRDSVAAYGLPDFTTVNIKDPNGQAYLRRMIEDAVKLFEPRLEAVTVTMRPLQGSDRVLRIRIEARLKVDPAPEPVTFDTVLQLHSGEYMVEGDG